MTRSSHRFGRAPLLLALGVALGACGGGAFFMRPSPDAPSAPAAGHARVIFVMPEGRTVVTLLDAFGSYLGQLRGGHYLSHDVAPGAYRFYAVRNVSGHVVHTAALVAGETYYVVLEDPLLAGFRLRAATCDEAREARPIQVRARRRSDASSATSRCACTKPISGGSGCPRASAPAGPSSAARLRPAPRPRVPRPRVPRPPWDAEPPPSEPEPEVACDLPPAPLAVLRRGLVCAPRAAPRRGAR
jgi:hypothetical protein